MSDPVRNISDTALWVAIYRARESARPDAVFHDPYAARLAGARGEEIARSMPFMEKASWSFVARTWLIDAMLTKELQQGTDMVVNLAAGLDARPYRMDLPPTLQWIEVDLPEMIDYKESVLAGEQPRCKLERVRLDLADVEARRALFDDLGRRSKRVMLITEGLLIYLTADGVRELARDLAAPSSFRRWTTDLASPGLLKMIRKNVSQRLDAVGAVLQFAPAEGPPFFEPLGWKPLEVEGVLRTAAKLRRLTFFMHLIAKFPESKTEQGSRPWSGVVLLGREP
jgi:methyltransferase (TIGR00027 family)